MKRISYILVPALIFSLAQGFAQDAAPPAFDSAKMEQILKEAKDLRPVRPKAVAGKLEPLLTELRRLRAAGTLDMNAIDMYQDALLLTLRTQAMLLTHERDLQATFRELLTVNPKVDVSLFNPREKTMLEKVRTAETGTLSLQTNPPGCTVFYLGNEMGVTPIEIPMVAGTYTLTLRKEGYLDQSVAAVVAKAEIATVTQELRRRSVDIPLSVNTADATVFINGQEAGTVLTYNKWLESLPSDKQRDHAAVTGAWKKDSSTIGFFRIPDIRLGQEFKVELRAPCYESYTITTSVKEEDVADWSRPVVSLPQLRLVELKKDLGFLEISSNPPGGEAWIDQVFLGKTPISKDLCSGPHRVQVVHRSGQYVQEVHVRRGQVAKVQGELKPAIAFLGVYTGSAPASPIQEDWQKVAKRMILRVTTFSDPMLTMEEMDALRKKSSPSFERLFDAKINPVELDALVKKTATDAGRVDLLLIGRKLEKKYQFRLFSTLHPLPDIIEIPNLEDESLDFIIANLDKANQAGTRLQAPASGLDLLESPKGLIVLKAVGEENKAIKQGSVIRAVDRKPMTYAEFWNYFRTRPPGQPISYELSAGKETTENVTTVPRFSGVEYPWHAPDGFPNAVLVMLNNLVETDPLSDRAKFASLGIARGLMHYGEWKQALDVLAKTNLDPYKSGICPGTVLYLQARCHEELGDKVMAESLYIRTKDYPDATVYTSEGISVQALSEQRIQRMKKSGR